MEKSTNISKEECTKLLKSFAETDNGKSGIVLFVPDELEYCFLSFGSGDNLSEEDYEAGYNDYIYIETKIWNRGKLLESGSGGGMYMFNNEKYIQNGEYKITNFVFEALEYGTNYLHCPNFVPLQFFD